MPATLQPAVFTLEIDRKPTLSFEARNLREAHEICHEAWLRDDVARLRSNDTTLWDGKVRLRARYATEAETAAYREVARDAVQTPDDILLAFLVDLDSGGPQDARQPGVPVEN